MEGGGFPFLGYYWHAQPWSQRLKLATASPSIWLEHDRTAREREELLMLAVPHDTNPKKESRVAHVFNRMDPGGAELRTVELVTECGLLFDFFCVAGGVGALDGQLKAAGHRVVNLKLQANTLIRYIRFLRVGKFQAVHCHLGLASGMVVLLAAVSGVPRRIVHFRSDGIGGHGRLGKRLYLLFSRACIKLFATHIIGVSPGALRSGWDPNWTSDERCRVIPNGYDSKRMRRQLGASGSSTRARDAPIRVINVGRPLPEKNRSRAIEVWQQLANTVPTELLLLGALSSEEEQLSVRAGAAVPFPSALKSVGFTPDARKHIAEADVLLVTSLREGLPGVVLEALALGIPVVSSNLPGVRWIQEYVAGITICDIAEENSIWAAALVAAATNDGEQIKKSFDASPFQLQHVLPQFLQIWGLK